MSFTVAFFLLAAGVVLGYHLRRPIERWRALWHERRYKPVILRDWQPDSDRPSKDS